MDKQIEEIKDWLSAVDDADNMEDYGRSDAILRSLYKDGHLRYLVEQAEQLHGTKGKKGYKAMFGSCNVDYANLYSENQDLKDKLSTILESYKIAFSQNERHRKLAESYKDILNFYSNAKNYDRPYDNEDYFDYLPSEMDFDKGERARQILRGEPDD